MTHKISLPHGEIRFDKDADAAAVTEVYAALAKLTVPACDRCRKNLTAKEVAAGRRTCSKEGECLTRSIARVKTARISASTARWAYMKEMGR